MAKTVNKGFVSGKDFYNVREFMDYTGISRPLAYSLITKKEIPTVRLGKRLLIPGWYLRKLSSEPSSQGA